MSSRNPLLLAALLGATLACPALAQEPIAPEADLARNIEKHQTGSKKLAIEQDELSADVQELVDEQTSAEVIALLEEVETVMIEVIDDLDAHETGGPTIAAETEIIEKIFEAAKKKAEQQQQQQGEPKEGEQEGQQPGEGQPGGQPGQGQSTAGAMLDMMRRMMGESPDGEPQEGKEGNQDGGGGGVTGESDAPNRKVDGSAQGNTVERTVPKNSGTAGAGLPEEFRSALDAYNRPRTQSTEP